MGRYAPDVSVDQVDEDEAKEIAALLLRTLGKKVDGIVPETRDRGGRLCHAGAGGLHECMAIVVGRIVQAKLEAKRIRGVEIRLSRKVDHVNGAPWRYLQVVLNMDLVAMGLSKGGG